MDAADNSNTETPRATPENRRLRGRFLWLYSAVGVGLMAAFGVCAAIGAGRSAELVWACAWAFLGFSAIVRKALNHWPDPLPSYWSIYPWAVAGLGAFVFGVGSLLAAGQPPHVFLALTAGPSFLLGYGVDRFV